MQSLYTLYQYVHATRMRRKRYLATLTIQMCSCGRTLITRLPKLKRYRIEFATE